jgi:transposase
LGKPIADESKHYEIGLSEFDIVKRITTEAGDYIYTVMPKERPEVCPNCGSKHIHVHKPATRNVRDLHEDKHRVGLIILGKRYRCIDCGTTIAMDYPSIYGSGKMTNRLREHLKQESFFHTFQFLSESYDISTPTIMKLFRGQADIFDKAYALLTPKVLGIDEVYLHNEYCCIFIDVLGKKIIEITPTRSKPIIIKMLNRFANKEQISCVTMDMWRPIGDAVNQVLPGVPVVVDKHHVIKELLNALEGIRKDIVRGIQDTKQRKSLKNNCLLLLHSAEYLSSIENQHLQELFLTYPQFETPYYLKEAFRDIYLTKTRDEAEKEFDEWIVVCRKEGVTKFNTFINAVLNWKTEIFNYFDSPYTNAETESLNNTIRELDRAGRGYTFDVLRAKTLFKKMYPEHKKFSFDVPDDE